MKIILWVIIIFCVYDLNTPPILFEISYENNGDLDLPRKGKERLDTTIVSILLKYENFYLTITGHSNIEECGVNDTSLSYARAVKAKKYIVSKGISKSRIDCKGMGGKEPHTYAEDGNVMRRCRRVRFSLYSKSNK